MYRTGLWSACFALLAVVVTGCTAYGGTVGEVARHPSQAAGIPPGHMPPPGECRIWYPDRPPGQQPPPGKCSELKHRVPPGATLVRG
jgi:hypothetical protein